MVRIALLNLANTYCFLFVLKSPYINLVLNPTALWQQCLKSYLKMFKMSFPVQFLFSFSKSKLSCFLGARPSVWAEVTGSEESQVTGHGLIEHTV